MSAVRGMSADGRTGGQRWSVLTSWRRRFLASPKGDFRSSVLVTETRLSIDHPREHGLYAVRFQDTTAHAPRTGLAARGAVIALRIVQISPAVNLFNRCTPLRITGARHHRIQPPRNMTSKLFPACSAFASPSAIPQPRSPVLREESRRCSMAGRNRRQKLGRYDGFL